MFTKLLDYLLGTKKFWVIIWTICSVLWVAGHFGLVRLDVTFNFKVAEIKFLDLIKWAFFISGPVIVVSFAYDQIEEWVRSRLREKQKAKLEKKAREDDEARISKRLSHLSDSERHILWSIMKRRDAIASINYSKYRTEVDNLERDGIIICASVDYENSGVGINSRIRVKKCYFASEFVRSQVQENIE